MEGALTLLTEGVSYGSLVSSSSEPRFEELRADAFTQLLAVGRWPEGRRFLARTASLAFGKRPLKPLGLLCSLSFVAGVLLGFGILRSCALAFGIYYSVWGITSSLSLEAPLDISLICLAFCFLISSYFSLLCLNSSNFFIF